MFTWICPKCGGEVPPSYVDCPRCAPKSSAATSDPQTDAPAAPAASATPLSPVAPPPAPLPPPPPARRLSPIAVALLAAVGLVALLGILYLYVLPRTSPTTGAATAALQSPGGPGSAEPAHPLAKHLELAGLRITESKPRMAKIQFLIINHSAADLPDLKLNVTLRPSAGGNPIFDFPADLPSIGPFESRDLTINVKTMLRPYEIPDWQLLRAEFRVAAEQ